MVGWCARGLAPVAGAWALALGSAWVHAAEPDAAAAQPLPTQRTVVIDVRGDAEQRAALALQLEGAIDDGVALSIDAVDTIDLAAAVAPGPGDPQTLARVWIDLAAGAHATIVLVDGARERVLIRHVAAPAGIDAAVRETIATICASAVEGLRAGAVIGIERAVAQAQLAPTTVAAEPTPVATALPAPARDAATPAPVIVLPLELGWAIAAWSSEHPIQHGPTFGLAVLARSRLQPGGGVAGQYRLPVHVEHSDVDARLDTGSLRAWAGVHPELAKRLRLRARLGGGIDLVRTAATTSPGVTPSATTVHPIPIARASLGVSIALAPGLTIAIDASLEVDLVDTEFVLLDPERPVFDPWRARPGLAIALAWDPLSPR